MSGRKAEVGEGEVRVRAQDRCVVRPGVADIDQGQEPGRETPCMWDV